MGLSITGVSLSCEKDWYSNDVKHRPDLSTFSARLPWEDANDCWRTKKQSKHLGGSAALPRRRRQFGCTLTIYSECTYSRPEVQSSVFQVKMETGRDHFITSNCLLKRKVGIQGTFRCCRCCGFRGRCDACSCVASSVTFRRRIKYIGIRFLEGSTFSLRLNSFSSSCMPLDFKKLILHGKYWRLHFSFCVPPFVSRLSGARHKALDQFLLGMLRNGARRAGTKPPWIF